jgi:hypothetical protein
VAGRDVRRIEPVVRSRDQDLDPYVAAVARQDGAQLFWIRQRLELDVSQVVFAQRRARVLLHANIEAELALHSVEHGLQIVDQLTSAVAKRSGTATRKVKSTRKLPLGAGNKDRARCRVALTQSDVNRVALNANMCRHERLRARAASVHTPRLRVTLRGEA